MIDLPCRHALCFHIIVHRIHPDRQTEPEHLADGDIERRADVHRERRRLRRLTVALSVVHER